MGCIFVFKIDFSVLYTPYRRDTFHVFDFTLAEDTRLGLAWKGDTRFMTCQRMKS